jgi:hypothetical protein
MTFFAQVDRDEWCVADSPVAETAALPVARTSGINHLRGCVSAA